jgi:hypothetical protein
MSCIITYNGNKYTQEQFKEYISSNKNEFSHIIASNKNVIDSFKRKMEGIDYVFSQSPELASIGNKAQYLQYLSTIFKTSKVKDIVYRGDDYFEENKGFLNKANDKKYTNGVYFAKSKREAASYSSNRKVYSAIIKLDNPIQSEVLPEYKKDKLNNNALTLEEISNLKKEGHDGLDITLKQESGFEYLVFEPKQIHILGSNQDIEGFKEFVDKSKSYLQPKEKTTKCSIM